MSKTETMKQSADAANAQSLTERARQQLQEVQELLEQVRAQSKAHPLTAEELEQKMEPLLSTLAMWAQVDIGHLEQATEHAHKGALAAASLRSHLSEATERAQEAATTLRAGLLEQVAWQAFLCMFAGLLGAGFLAALLHFGVGLSQPALHLDCRKVQAEIQRQQAPLLPQR